MSLPTRALGKNGPQVAALGFGTMGLCAAVYGAPESDDVRFMVLDRALELGENFWDSGDVYGDSEDLLGRWFAKTGKRDQIFLSSKFGIKGTRAGPVVDGTPEYVKEACAKSLKRLGVDCIDLYYYHRMSKSTPIEQTVEAMVELKNEGKIKYIGLSECSSESLRRACKIHHIAAVQVEYSPFTTDIEDPKVNLLSTCRELGVAIVAYSPLGRGFLTGLYKSVDELGANDFRRTVPRFSDENLSRNLALVEKFENLATQKGCTSGQLTLAWLLAQGNDIIPIPGTKKIGYLEENLKSVNVVLSADEVKEISTLVRGFKVFGDRYSQAMMAITLADTPNL